MSCKPGVAGSIPGSHGRDLARLLRRLKIRTTAGEPLGAPGHKKPQNYEPTRLVLVIAKECGHKQTFALLYY